jgi:hypothetical protein
MVSGQNPMNDPYFPANALMVQILGHEVYLTFSLIVSNGEEWTTVHHRTAMVSLPTFREMYKHMGEQLAAWDASIAESGADDARD